MIILQYYNITIILQTKFNIYLPFWLVINKHIIYFIYCIMHDFYNIF